MKSKKIRKERREQIANEILTSKEVQEILGFSRVRLNQVVKNGKITPIRQGLYLKDDILAYQQEREKLMKEQPNWFNQNEKSE